MNQDACSMLRLGLAHVKKELSITKYQYIAGLFPVIRKIHRCLPTSTLGVHSFLFVSAWSTVQGWVQRLAEGALCSLTYVCHSGAGVEVVPAMF